MGCMIDVSGLLFPGDELVAVQEDADGGHPRGRFRRGHVGCGVRADQAPRVVGMCAVVPPGAAEEVAESGCLLGGRWAVVAQLVCEGEAGLVPVAACAEDAL